MLKVCICGSVKQKDEILEIAEWHRELGYNVTTPVLYENNFTKEELRLIHRGKITYSDIIVILTKPNGELGEDTKKEKEYAIKIGKTVVEIGRDKNDR